MSSKVSSAASIANEQQVQDQQPFPEADAEAISFLSSFGMDEELLFFPETLTIISDTGEPQGELTIEVQSGKYKDDMGIITHCLLVHAFSRSFIDKALCGSSLLGRVPAVPSQPPLQSICP